MHTFRLTAVCLALASALACSAQTSKPAAPQSAHLDVKAKPVMDKLSAAYRGLDSLHERISATAKGPTEMTGRVPESIELKYRKPNKIWMSLTEKLPDGKLVKSLLVCDGSWLWRWSEDTNTYRKTKAPAALKAIPDLPNDSPEMELLFRDKEPLADFTPAEAVFTLAAPQKVGDAQVDVVEAKLSPADVPISASVRLLVGQADHLFHGLQFVGSGTNPNDNKPVEFDVRLNYDLVDASPAFTAADFAFVPPPGSKPAITAATQTTKPRTPVPEKPVKKK